MTNNKAFKEAWKKVLFQSVDSHSGTTLWRRLFDAGWDLCLARECEWKPVYKVRQDAWVPQCPEFLFDSSTQYEERGLFKQCRWCGGRILTNNKGG